MLILNKISELSVYLEKHRSLKRKIGFVPTMGALHEGHISLVNKAKKENDIVVVSIFVNPTQFNNPEDLKNYPRTPKEDEKMLGENNVDIIFSPLVEEIYNPETIKKNVLELGQIADVMEGVHRPGHFDGVVQIVSKLFEIVKPQKAYFGEKDFQQLAVIRLMVNKIRFPVEIIACPTVREKSGLAMSSRNLKLSKNGLQDAAEISKTLFYVKENWKKFNPVDLKERAIEMIESSGKLKVEYVEISEEESLQPAKEWNPNKHIRCFAAVYCEEIRLIDNIQLSSS